MKRIYRSIRISMWLTQSFIKRYRTHVLVATSIGAIVMILFWKIYPVAQKKLFPERTVIGIVGMYQPNELPLSIQNYISVGFTDISEAGEATPKAVSKWEISKEGTLYLFHLKQNIYWHDGQELTAHDVNYNFRDVTIAPADRYTLKLELEDSFSPLPTLLSQPLFKEGLVGIGPYKVVQLKTSGELIDTLVLQKAGINTIPSETKYTTEIIEFRFYPSIDAAVLAFKLGEIDYIKDLFNKTELENEQNVTITETVSTSKVLALFYNQTNNMLGSKEFRQGLSYAAPMLDGENVLSAIPSASWAYNENARQYNNDPEKAREMFEKSGISEGSFTISVFPEYYNEAEFIAQTWKEYGYDVSVKVVRSFPSQWDILLGVQEIPSDPDQYQLWHSTQEKTNITGYNNPKIDKLLEEGRKLQTKEERLEVYNEFQRYIMEDNPAHFLIHPTVYTISRT